MRPGHGPAQSGSRQIATVCAPDLVLFDQRELIEITKAAEVSDQLVPNCTFDPACV